MMLSIGSRPRLLCRSSARASVATLTNCGRAPTMLTTRMSLSVKRGNRLHDVPPLTPRPENVPRRAWQFVAVGAGVRGADQERRLTHRVAETVLTLISLPSGGRPRQASPRPDALHRASRRPAGL